MQNLLSHSILMAFIAGFFFFSWYSHGYTAVGWFGGSVIGASDNNNNPGRGGTGGREWSNPAETTTLRDGS